MSGDNVQVHVAQTAEETERIRASSRDLTSYPHISVIVAADPDAVGAVLANVDVRIGAPCFRQVAKMLREIAEQLEEHHPPGECGVH